MSAQFCVLVCLCFIGLTYGKTEDEIKAYFLQLGMECSKENPITTEEALILARHKLPQSKAAKCLMACIYKKATWLDDKGMFVVDNAHSMVTDNLEDADKAANGHKLFDECKKVNDESVEDGEEGCERSGLLFLCLTENAPKMGFNLKRLM